jgi:catechol 2,3-dioxygenase-like lactoylglutathione lyase family enzyme
MPAAPIRVRQIDHVTFVVRDLEASRAFYEGILGMKCVPRPTFNFAGLWFQAGNTQIHLILQHPESGPAGASLAEGLAISRTHHVAFEVDEAKPAIERLNELGVPIVSGPKFRPDGPTQFYVLDPDGNLIELFAIR